MLQPVFHRDGLHAHSFHHAAIAHLVGDDHLVIDGHGVPQASELLVVFGKPQLGIVAVFLVFLVQPFLFVHRVVRVKDHRGRVEHGLVLHSAPEELVHQCRVAVQHVPVCLQNVLRIVPAYAVVAPLPQVERVLTVFHVRAQVLAEDIEIAVLVNRQAVVPADSLFKQISAPMHLSMNKGAVHFTIDVGD